MNWSEDDIDAPQDIDLHDDGDDGDDGPVVECPNCRAWMSELGPRCPECGEWVIGDPVAGQRSRGWFWPVMVAGLIAVILVIWHGLGR